MEQGDQSELRHKKSTSSLYSLTRAQDKLIIKVLTVVFMIPVPWVLMELAMWRMLIAFRCLLSDWRWTNIYETERDTMRRHNRLHCVPWVNTCQSWYHSIPQAQPVFSTGVHQNNSKLMVLMALLSHTHKYYNMWGQSTCNYNITGA